jgi:hypothetical protein
VKDECEIVVLWSLTIHGSWRRTTLCCVCSWIQAWVHIHWSDTVVLNNFDVIWLSGVNFITPSWPVDLLLTK